MMCVYSVSIRAQPRNSRCEITEQCFQAIIFSLIIEKLNILKFRFGSIQQQGIKIFYNILFFLEYFPLKLLNKAASIWVSGSEIYYRFQISTFRNVLR